MHLRDALISQTPSLTLQRAAHQEISALDYEVALLARSVAALLAAHDAMTSHTDPAWPTTVREARTALAACKARRPPKETPHAG